MDVKDDFVIRFALGQKTQARRGTPGMAKIEKMELQAWQKMLPNYEKDKIDCVHSDIH